MLGFATDAEAGAEKITAESSTKSGRRICDFNESRPINKRPGGSMGRTQNHNCRKASPSDTQAARPTERWVGRAPASPSISRGYVPARIEHRATSQTWDRTRSPTAPVTPFARVTRSIASARGPSALASSPQVGLRGAGLGPCSSELYLKYIFSKKYTGY